MLFKPFNSIYADYEKAEIYIRLAAENVQADLTSSLD